MNVLNPNSQLRGFLEACYWSSSPSDDVNSTETLDFKLAHPLCMVHEIHVQPFKAYFQPVSAVCNCMLHVFVAYDLVLPMLSPHIWFCSTLANVCGSCSSRLQDLTSEVTSSNTLLTSQLGNLHCFFAGLTYLPFTVCALPFCFKPGALIMCRV